MNNYLLTLTALLTTVTITLLSSEPSMIQIKPAILPIAQEMQATSLKPLATSQQSSAQFKSLKDIEYAVATSTAPICIAVIDPSDKDTMNVLDTVEQEFGPDIEFMRLDATMDEKQLKTITHIVPTFLFKYKNTDAIERVYGFLPLKEFRIALENVKKHVAAISDQSATTLAKFERKIIENERAAVLIFTSSRCQPCAFMKPFIEELKESLKGIVKFKRYFYEADYELRDIFNITVLPTFIFMKKGKEVYRFTGATDKKAFNQVLISFMSQPKLDIDELDHLVAKGKENIEEDYMNVDVGSNQEIPTQIPPLDDMRLNVTNEQVTVNLKTPSDIGWTGINGKIQ